MKNLYFLLIGFAFLFACTPNSPNQNEEITTLKKMMTGEFSSADQAAADSAFFDISLVMYPVWEDDQDAQWLYVEQAVTAMANKPYRQRMYRLAYAEDGSIESRVYELPTPERFIHAWNQPDIFKTLGVDSLVVRQGCSVFLKKDENGCFSGSTPGKECLSSLRGATYATSKVTICPDQIESWDQGWDKNDEQVWGAEIGGYVFKKKI